MRNVICSHGFGVKADSRGMFPELAASLPAYRFVMFDYNEVLPNADTVVASLDAQAASLQKVIDAQPAGSLLLCHSQGCIIAGLVDLSRVSKVVLLAPPTAMSMQRVIDKLLARPGRQLRPEGVSTLPRRDGTTTHITSDYLRSLENRHPLQLYEQIAAAKPTLIIRATADELLGHTDVDTVRHARHADIADDHNFTGQGRAELAQALRAFFKAA